MPRALTLRASARIMALTLATVACGNDDETTTATPAITTSQVSATGSPTTDATPGLHKLTLGEAVTVAHLSRFHAREVRGYHLRDAALQDGHVDGNRPPDAIPEEVEVSVNDDVPRADDLVPRDVGMPTF